MKFVILLALVAYTAAEDHQPPHGGDTLHNMIHNEVANIVQANAGIGVDDCTTKCDALFDLNENHDEHTTDTLCQMECLSQAGGDHHHHGHGGN